MTDTYVAIDLETTGLDPKKEKIIEIGAVKVVDGQVAEEFATLVDPRRLLEERISELTGITDAELSGAPYIDEVIGPAAEFIGDLPLLGHRILFDYSFLKRAAVNRGIPFERDGIDTLTLCRKFMPEDERKNLEHACEFFGIDTGGAHRAMKDARAAHLLFQRLKRDFLCREPSAFEPKPLVYKAKKDQPATKRQKEHLHDLIKYHKICLTVQIDGLTRSEASWLTDQILAQYGRMNQR